MKYLEYILDILINLVNLEYYLRSYAAIGSMIKH